MPTDLCKANATSNIVSRSNCTGPNAYSVITTADAGAGSLRQAILSANANPNFSTIRFNLPSNNKAIALSSALPAITAPILIDGSTQPNYNASDNTTFVQVSGPITGEIGNGLLFNGMSQGSSVIGLKLSNFPNYGIFTQVENVTMKNVNVK